MLALPDPSTARTEEKRTFPNPEILSVLFREVAAGVGNHIEKIADLSSNQLGTLLSALLIGTVDPIRGSEDKLRWEIMLKTRKHLIEMILERNGQKDRGDLTLVHYGPQTERTFFDPKVTGEPVVTNACKIAAAALRRRYLMLLSRKANWRIINPEL